jgi:hypothetical protein
MMQQWLPWYLALGLLAATGVGVAGWWLGMRRSARTRPLPDEWTLTPRPVFNTDERRLYRQLREALPHHVVLAKLPLVRFCQPADPQQVRYWYDLLGSTHVAFAICSANGRVLAAIDFDGERGGSRRTVQVKQSVLGACRIRYLRCPIDHLPSVPELQLLVPQPAAPTRGPRATVSSAMPTVHDARDSLAATVASRRRQRRPLWQDSGFFHDSFFGADSRMDATMPSEFTPFSPPPPPPARGSGTEPGRGAAPSRGAAPGWVSRLPGDADGLGRRSDDPPRYGTSPDR